MNSFYGGKEGRTYNIVHTYKSIEEMVKNFALGAAYPEVSYGQYVMIDTDSKNNPDNGRLYRRGINYSDVEYVRDENDNLITIAREFDNPGAGAIYIGQIVGPDGKVPKLSFVDISYIENHESEEKDIILFDEDRKDAVEVDENNQIQENPIKIGYVNEFNEEEGKYAGKIGIDIPKTVFKIDAEIIPADQDGQETNHYDIAYNNNTYSIDFSNPIHQHNSSTKAVENGIEYYDYKLIVPTPSNFNIINNNTSYDSQGHLTTPSTYQLVYDTVENNQKITKTIDTNIELPIRLDFKNSSGDSTGDLITYTTNKNKTVVLGNPNGQFHLYTWLKQDEQGNSFTSVQDVIDYLNNSEKYKYGIRIPTNDNKYDLTQAGWLIAADIKTQGSGEIARADYATVGISTVATGEEQEETPVEKTCLFAFDYVTENGEQYNLNNLAIDPDPAVTFKGWFLVQDFNSSLASDPVQIILVGSQNIDVTESDIMELKDKGIWLYGQESEAKWW